MRIGIDLGGTKVEIIALDGCGNELLRKRQDAPRGSYDTTVRTICGLVEHAERELGQTGTVGIGIPGTISPQSGLIKNANSTWLIGHAFDKDVAAALGRPVRIANDANCFALSEATDGAGKDHRTVFGVIAGTGVGSGIVFDGRILNGAHAIAGEWGHNPLPWPRADELPGPDCYCHKFGCIESWCSGPALSRQFRERTGREASAKDIAALAARGDKDATVLMDQFLDRLARAIATVVNLIDPDAVVFGGGLSNIDAIYRELPGRIVPYTFNAETETRILKNIHGDSSGVRGAAWLWREDETG